MTEIKSFDIKQTNIAKGIALLLLLWHHLFMNSAKNYDSFVSLFKLGNIPVECIVSNFAKVCVAIFLFLSGFGLYKSYNSNYNRISQISKYSIKNDISFISKHLIKLMSGFWLIYIIFVSMGFFLGRNPVEIYQGNILYFVVDFLGLANVFSTPTMNATWWFMGAIIVYYLLFPLLVKIQKWSAEFLVILSAFLLLAPYLPNIGQLRTWLLPFTLGMYFAQRDIFARLSKEFNSFFKASITFGILIIIALLVKYTDDYSVRYDSLLAISIILFSFLVLSKIPIVNKVLEQLGKHSGAIFMFHTFIFSYYFHDFIYSFKYSVLIFIVMTVICYIVAVMLEQLKKLIRYDKLVNLICSKI